MLPQGSSAAGRWYAQAELPYGAPGLPQPHFDLEFTLYLPRVLDEHVDSPEKKKEDAP